MDLGKADLDDLKQYTESTEDYSLLIRNLSRIATTATALAGATVAAAYLDAKLFISKDLNFLYRINKGQKNFEKAGMNI